MIDLGILLQSALIRTNLHIRNPIYITTALDLCHSDWFVIIASVNTISLFLLIVFHRLLSLHHQMISHSVIFDFSNILLTLKFWFKLEFDQISNFVIPNNICSVGQICVSELSTDMNWLWYFRVEFSTLSHYFSMI